MIADTGVKTVENVTGVVKSKWPGQRAKLIYAKSREWHPGLKIRE